MARLRSSLVLWGLISSHDTAIMGSKLGKGNFPYHGKHLSRFRIICIGNENHILPLKATVSNIIKESYADPNINCRFESEAYRANFSRKGMKFFCMDGKIYWGLGIFFLKNPSKLKKNSQKVGGG